MNSFGRHLRLTTFGESHGLALGGVLDGFPAGWRVDEEAVQLALSRRRPGASPLATARKEPDQVRFLSGIYEGKTLGTPIAFMIANEDQRSGDYTALADTYRPGHADLTYTLKYGHRDPRGGGRASARETVARVVAGALASQWLEARGISIFAYLSTVGAIQLEQPEWTASHPSPQHLQSLQLRYDQVLPCPCPETAERMARAIQEARTAGDSLGAIISCEVYGLPAGLGEPIYDKLSSRLAAAMLSINASRGFELGEGFTLASRRGSESNDALLPSEEDAPQQATNHTGGLLGGITTGAPLTFRTAFKPTSSIALPQQTVDRDGLPTSLTITGRHDPCVGVRAVPIVEAMTALTLMDFYLLHQRPELGRYDGADR